MIRTSKFNSTPDSTSERPALIRTVNFQEVDFFFFFSFWFFDETLMFPVGESGSFCSQIQKTVVLMCPSHCIQTGIVRN